MVEKNIPVFKSWFFFPLSLKKWFCPGTLFGLLILLSQRNKGTISMRDDTCFVSRMSFFSAVIITIFSLNCRFLRAILTWFTWKTVNVHYYCFMCLKKSHWTIWGVGHETRCVSRTIYFFLLKDQCRKWWVWEF